MNIFTRRLLPETTDLAQEFYEWRAGNPAEQLRQKQEHKKELQLKIEANTEQVPTRAPQPLPAR